MVSSFRLNEEDKATIEEIRTVLGGAKIDALREIIAMQHQIGSLSFMTAYEADGTIRRVMETPKIVTLYRRHNGGVWLPSERYTRGRFLATFFLHEGLFWHTKTAGNSLPEGAFFITHGE